MFLTIQQMSDSIQHVFEMTNSTKTTPPLPVCSRSVRLGLKKKNRAAAPRPLGTGTVPEWSLHTSKIVQPDLCEADVRRSKRIRIKRLSGNEMIHYGWQGRSRVPVAVAHHKEKTKRRPIRRKSKDYCPCLRYILVLISNLKLFLFFRRAVCQTEARS